MTVGTVNGGSFKAPLLATALTSGGAICSILNPQGVDLIITRALLDISTQSIGAATASVGVGSTATTSSANLIDTKSVAAAGLFDNITDGSTNGKARQIWPAGQYVTVTGSATTAGMVGNLILQFVPR